MAKRKITVTVDEDLLTDAQTAPGESLSGFVNVALRAEHERRARRTALQVLLDQWDSEHGPVDAETRVWASAAFDAAAAPVTEGAA